MTETRSLCHHHPGGVRVRNLFARVPKRALLLACDSLLFLSLSCSEEVITARGVPGTERIDPTGSSAWFTISPDDQWMAFMEIDSMYPTPPSDSGFPTSHLVTMSLKSLQKTHHTFAELPPSPFCEDHRTWNEVHARFDEASWKDGNIILECCWQRNAPWMMFTPGVVPATISKPATERSCSDCAPTHAYEVRAQRFRWASTDHGEVSISPINASRNSNVYTIERGRSNTIVRIDSTSRHERIVSIRHLGWNHHVYRVRVSPDERYLAFVVEETPLVAIPFAYRCELYIVDLRSGRKARIANRYRHASGILWTSDSQRFYFAAVSQEHGVYVVDVAAFGQSD
jgi:hypothetical protein